MDYQVDGVGDHDGCYPYWLAPDSDRDEQNDEASQVLFLGFFDFLRGLFYA
ncbi:hypothetical protein [Actinotignum sp. GS-2025e]|uniref:hypothetical protein n=1 Tax=Actinotignum sp. GS-2025e TaxID=3427278 RepID=UPI003F4C054F